jgi:hypothetical protein
MSGVSFIPEFVYTLVLMIVLFWPGYRAEPLVEPPKKGYWTVGTAFWPIRKAYQQLFPVNKILSAAFRRALLWALILTYVLRMLTKYVPAVASHLNPGWYLAEFGVAAFLVGRASGFWSADRRIRSSAAEPMNKSAAPSA